MSIRKSAAYHKVSKGTVQNAKKYRAEIMNEFLQNRSMEKFRMAKETDINIIVYRWFSVARASGYPISGPILQEKAKIIAQKFGVHENKFSASEGWLHKWKTRNNIKSYTLSAEFGAYDIHESNKWKANLNLILEDYSMENIFNIDETSYFYRALPDKT